MSTRKYQKKHREKYHGEKEEYHASHIIPANVMEKYNIHDDPSNYRNKDPNTNLAVDTIIDNQVFNGSFTPAYTSDGRYVSKQMAADRIEQQVNYLKKTNQANNHRYVVNQLYQAAQKVGADLQIFNDIAFRRTTV